MVNIYAEKCYVSMAIKCYETNYHFSFKNICLICIIKEKKVSFLKMSSAGKIGVELLKSDTVMKLPVYEEDCFLKMFDAIKENNKEELENILKEFPEDSRTHIVNGKFVYEHEEYLEKTGKYIKSIFIPEFNLKVTIQYNPCNLKILKLMAQGLISFHFFLLLGSCLFSFWKANSPFLDLMSENLNLLLALSVSSVNV